MNNSRPQIEEQHVPVTPIGKNYASSLRTIQGREAENRMYIGQSQPRSTPA